MIALGIKVDEKSFQKADAAFGGLTKSALQLGAVLAGKLAIDKVVGDFKNVGTELDNFHKLTNLSTQKVQVLGQAFTAMGGSASEAFGTFQKVQDLMKSPMTGEIKWAADAFKYGFDADVILNKDKAGSVEEALANIAGEMEKLPLLQKRLAGQAMGFSDNEINLLIKGRAEVEKHLDIRGKLAVMTDKEVKDAARLTSVMSDVDGVFTDIGNTIAGELTPAFADMAEDFVKFYRGNKELIDSGLKEFFGGVAKNIELVAIAMALLGGGAALKGLAALRGIVAAGGGAGAGAAGAAGGIAARSLLTNPLTVGLAALGYSGSIGEGEDDDLLNNRLKKGGDEAFSAVVGYLTKNGIPHDAAVGLAAGIEKESGFDAKAVGDNGKAQGLAQWHKPRQLDFFGLNRKGILESSGKEQLDFMIHELKEGNEKDKLKLLEAATNQYEGGYIASKAYFRPADKEGEAVKRGSRAAEYDDTPIARPPYERQDNGVNASPSYTDNRQFHIHGADTEKVKQLYTEQLRNLTEQTMQDFRSPEK